MSVFDPIQVGRYHAKNRFARAATKEQMCSEGGHIPQEIFDFYEKLAEGGVGTIIVSSARVKLFHGTNPQGLFRLDRDDLLPEYQKLAAIGKKYGTTMIIQATYSRRDPDTITRLDLERVATQYAEAAIFAERAGFDGIEIHEAHNMFMSTMLKPAFNHRTDEYGVNKSLLSERVIHEIRRHVGPNFILISKIDSSDPKNNYTAEEALEHGRALEKAGIDAIEVSGASVAQAAKTREQESYFKDFAIRLKKEVSVPVMLVGGNKSLEVIEPLHEEYGIDLFSISRALTREFNLINRWQNGDKSPSKCLSCDACGRTMGHLCPFNKENNPFDASEPCPYDTQTGRRLTPEELAKNRLPK